jgi:alkylresorcinol/alkylpyrone synthase
VNTTERPSRPPVQIRAVGRALPGNFVDQESLTAALREAWGGVHFNPERLEELHRSVQVSGRCVALPLQAYRELTTFARHNEAWIRAAVDLGEVAIRNALGQAGLSPSDVDHVVFVTTTGIATPSIDARLVNRLGFRRDIRRTPLFGLGCLGGAAGLARASDLLATIPGQVAVLLSVELCSLTLQLADLSVANVIASGLFGDGAAAVVLTGGVRDPEGPESAPSIVASGSAFYPDTERAMGWDVVDSGLKVVLSAQVPEIVRRNVRADVDELLAKSGLDRSSIRHWVAHTGGPKVLQAFESSLELPAGALARSWKSLRDVGNLSSASVLFVLADLLSSGEPVKGDFGLLMAMGPGFCSELVLLEW